MVGREPQARLGLLVQVFGRSRVVVYGEDYAVTISA